MPSRTTNAARGTRMPKWYPVWGNAWSRKWTPKMMSRVLRATRRSMLLLFIAVLHKLNLSNCIVDMHDEPPISSTGCRGVEKRLTALGHKSRRQDLAQDTSDGKD